VKIIAGNWKMNGTGAALEEAVALRQALEAEPAGARVALFPPFTLVERMARALGGRAVEVGGQDCHAEAKGAYTGSISAGMLAEAGATLVIVGHSERRAGFGETDADVAAKARAALAAGLTPVICVGEPMSERDAGRAADHVRAQLLASIPDEAAGRDFVVAYEPIWCVGSGCTPTMDEIGAVHGVLRRHLVERFGEAGRAVPILYGGSVTAANAGEILAVPDVGGALVGGASLKAADFLGIVRAA
jgi:triosephosphate isomerase